MNQRQIEAFKTVMVTGSATKAADIMCITQPAVSRLIADLEYNINFKLFYRKPNRLIPTPEAKLLFLEVQRAFIGMDVIRRSAEGIAQKQKGRIRIAALSFCIDSFLPKLIAAYLEKYPDVAIEILAAGRTSFVDLIDSQQFDLGLAYLPTHKSSCSVRPFVENQAVCVLPKTHRLCEKKTIAAEDLEEENFIALSQSSNSFRMPIDEVFDKASVRRKISVETGTQLAICNIVAAGAGLSIVDPLVANSMAKNVAIRPFKPIITWTLAMLLPPVERISLVTQSFSDQVYKYFQKNDQVI